MAYLSTKVCGRRLLYPFINHEMGYFAVSRFAVAAKLYKNQ